MMRFDVLMQVAPNATPRTAVLGHQGRMLGGGDAMVLVDPARLELDFQDIMVPADRFYIA
jgi:hypothetical protein